jgi:hypothetical protein
MDETMPIPVTTTRLILPRQPLSPDAASYIFCLSMIFADLPSPAEASFAKVESRYPLFGIML